MVRLSGRFIICLPEPSKTSANRKERASVVNRLHLHSSTFCDGWECLLCASLNLILIANVLERAVKRV